MNALVRTKIQTQDKKTNLFKETTQVALCLFSTYILEGNTELTKNSKTDENEPDKNKH